MEAAVQTLKDVAEREAREAEAQIAAEEAAEVQGDGVDQPWEREPTPEETENAGEVVSVLEAEAEEMGPEGTVDALIQVVDVHADFTVPNTWPGETDEEFREAPVLRRIGVLLAKASPKIEVSPYRVAFLWKNKKSWTRQGVQIRAQGKSLDGLTQFFTDGKVAAVIGNYQHFRLLNTRQKVASVYHALRSFDKDGAVIPNQFEGFFDELELFGTGTFQSDVALASAVSRAQERQLPFQLSLLDEPED